MTADSRYTAIREALAHLCDCGTEVYRTPDAALAALDSLTADLDGLTVEVADLQNRRMEVEGECAQWSSQARSAEADLAAATEALREIVGESYNLITQGESPTQRRQPSAARIYDVARAFLASQEGTE